MDVFYEKVQGAFQLPLSVSSLESFSQTLLAQLRDALLSDGPCMLKSFADALPRGDEEGIYVALDVGGSTFRVALVELYGNNRGAESPIRVVRTTSHVINTQVRDLEGRLFFEWMADKMKDTLSVWPEEACARNVGLAWSFPLDQTLVRDGHMSQMGKGFRASEGLVGQSLVALLAEACQQKGLSVSVRAVVNDSSASLLSAVYRDGYANMAFIVGTGLNATVHLSTVPLSTMASRVSDPASLEANEVLVNTELSMFGKDVFPLTKWDELLRLSHPRPDFQPLEYLTSGRYLGEIVRIILVDAVHSAGLFQRKVPLNFGAYELTSDTITVVEADTSSSLEAASIVLTRRHPPCHEGGFSVEEVRQVRDIACLVSARAAAFVAVSMTSLHQLRLEKLAVASQPSARVNIGCSGGVIESYPSFLDRVQATLDGLSGGTRALRLVLNPQSALTGAAIAAACL